MKSEIASNITQCVFVLWDQPFLFHIKSNGTLVPVYTNNCFAVQRCRLRAYSIIKDLGLMNSF